MNNIRIVVMVAILGIFLGNVAAQEDVQGISYVCGDTYTFQAADPENWLIVPQDRPENIMPQNGDVISSSGGLIVWHELSYEYVYGNAACSAAASASTQTEFQMLQFVREQNIDLEGIFGG